MFEDNSEAMKTSRPAKVINPYWSQNSQLFPSLRGVNDVAPLFFSLKGATKNQIRRMKIKYKKQIHLNEQWFLEQEKVNVERRHYKILQIQEFENIIQTQINKIATTKHASSHFADSEFLKSFNFHEMEQGCDFEALSLFFATHLLKNNFFPKKENIASG